MTSKHIFQPKAFYDSMNMNFKIKAAKFRQKKVKSNLDMHFLLLV